MEASVWTSLATIDMGSLPDWIAAISTAFALVFAYRAVRAANRQNRHQAEQLHQLEEDQRERDEEHRREQASKVSLWWERGEVSGSSLSHMFYYSNASDHPVTDVVFVVTTPVRTHQSLAVPFIGPRTDFANNGTLDEVFDRVITEYQDEGFTGHGPNGDMAALEFTDMNGQRWRRNLSGKLTRRDSASH